MAKPHVDITINATRERTTMSKLEAYAEFVRTMPAAGSSTEGVFYAGWDAAMNAAHEPAGPTPPRPTVGQVVHYVDRDSHGASICHPAVVTEVPVLLSEQPNDGTSVHATVFSPRGTHFRFDVHRDTTLLAATWHHTFECPDS